MTKIEELEF